MKEMEVKKTSAVLIDYVLDYLIGSFDKGAFIMVRSIQEKIV